MTKSSCGSYHKINEFNEKTHNRSVRLAKLAAAKVELEKTNTEIDRKAFVQITIEVDEEHKGISLMTVYRNPEVSEIFESICPKEAEKKEKIKGLKSTSHKRKKISSKEQYEGISRTKLIELIEDLRKLNTELKEKLDGVSSERSQLLKQNSHQVYILDKLQQILNKLQTEGKYIPEIEG